MNVIRLHELNARCAHKVLSHDCKQPKKALSSVLEGKVLYLRRREGTCYAQNACSEFKKFEVDKSEEKDQIFMYDSIESCPSLFFAYLDRRVGILSA